MNSIINLLFGNDNNVKRKSVFWNMLASIAYSLQSAVLLLIVTRIAGLYAAGVFSIAYTITQMFANVGSYCMRSYQVSDSKEIFCFGTYLTSRIVTVTAMFLSCIGYSIIKGYNGEKLFIIVLLCLYRAVDGLEDVYHGEVQKLGRLDVASKVLVIRIVIVTICFMIVYMFSGSLILSTMALTASAIFFGIILNAIVIRKLHIDNEFIWKGLIKLLITCFPVFIGAFLYSYLVNTPKYAIDNILSSEMQTIFNIIFIPIFVINMLSGFIFKPYIAEMGIIWNKEQKTEFFGLIIKQSVYVLLLTIIVAVGGYVAGVPVLSWIYGIGLSDYKILLVVLLLFGGISALDTFLSVVLTVMRRQIFIMVGYLIALGVDVVLMNYLVKSHGLWGAGLVYGLAMGVILLVFMIGIILGFIDKKGKNTCRN